MMQSIPLTPFPPSGAPSPSGVNSNHGGQLPTEPPGTHCLDALAGKIVGCNGMKVACGVVIGVGIGLLGTGVLAPLGVALIVAGGLGWLASTGTSTAALREKTASTIAYHLSKSFALGCAGVAIGLMGVTAIVPTSIFATNTALAVLVPASVAGGAAALSGIMGDVLGVHGKDMSSKDIEDALFGGPLVYADGSPA